MVTDRHSGSLSHSMQLKSHEDISCLRLKRSWNHVCFDHYIVNYRSIWKTKPIMCDVRNDTFPSSSILSFLSKKWNNSSLNKAGYTATEVACGWARAILEVTRSFRQEQWGQINKIIKKVKWGLTDQLIDGRMDKAGCRVACTRLKITFLRQNVSHSY